MFKRIDLFRPVAGKVDILHYFTERLAEALKAIGVKTRILTAEYHNPRAFVEQLLNDVPDCTLCFNGLLPDHEGRFFSDLVKIPHVAYLIDSPIDYTIMTASNYTIMTCPDRFSSDFLKGLEFNHTIYLPHGVERQLAPSRDPRVYDVAMFAPLIDYETIAENWENRLDPKMVNALYEAADQVLNTMDASPVHTLVEVLNKISEEEPFDPSTCNFTQILSELEEYIKGKDRIDLLHSFKETKVHIFGSASPTATWDKYIHANQKNIEIHPPVSFTDAVELMKQTRVVLSSNAWMKGGVHFMTLYGLMAGALVLTHGNSYMCEFFIDGESIAYYNHNQPEAIEQTVQQYLTKESLRWEVALHGREEVMRRHTWDHRAQSLVKQLDGVLASIITKS